MCGERKPGEALLPRLSRYELRGPSTSGSPTVLSCGQRPTPEPRHPAAEPAECAVSRRWLAVIAVAVVAAAIDVGMRNMALASLLDAVEATETVMESQDGRLRNLIEGRDGRGFVQNAMNEQDREKNRRAFRAVFAGLEADLIVAADPMEDVFIAPHWTALADFRSDYLDHVDAWLDRFSTVRDDLNQYQESFPAISSTFRIACSSADEAVPVVDFVNAAARVEDVCDD